MDTFFLRRAGTAARPPAAVARLRPARGSAAAAALLAAALTLAGCARGGPTDNERAAPLVRAVAPTLLEGQSIGVSGTVRAHIETPLAFQVGGRIARRIVAAGQQVRAGAQLLQLDPRDLDEALRAAEAEHAAAQTALATADADLQRARSLAAQAFVSAQVVERAELQRREALARRDAAAARLAQARNARAYAILTAPADGVILDVSGEPGQVVAAGQPVATLAYAGAREVEVFFAEGVTPPARGVALLADGRELPLVLREVAAAVEPLGRTRRARYRVAQGGDALLLGTVVRTRFAAVPGAANASGVFALPIAALDERGRQPQVWRIRAGKVDPLPVQVLAVDDARAFVTGALAATDRIVALGTHLLQPGMAVRELTP